MNKKFSKYAFKKVSEIWGFLFFFFLMNDACTSLLLLQGSADFSGSLKILPKKFSNYLDWGASSALIQDA